MASAFSREVPLTLTIFLPSPPSPSVPLASDRPASGLAFELLLVDAIGLRLSRRKDREIVFDVRPRVARDGREALDRRARRAAEQADERDQDGAPRLERAVAREGGLEG